MKYQALFTMKQQNKVCVYIGEGLARYAFGHGHPFGPKRKEAFWDDAVRLDLDTRVHICEPRTKERAQWSDAPPVKIIKGF